MCALADSRPNVMSGTCIADTKLQGYEDVFCGRERGKMYNFLRLIMLSVWQGETCLGSE